MSNDGGSRGGKGRIVGGRYRLVERIGSGGMGTVWRAVDELVEREVAVKQPRLPWDPESESHQRAAHRLYREARAAARVDHPSAVSIHDVVVEGEGEGGGDGAGEGGGVDGLPWIVMELVRGESLHEVLQRGPLEPAESARIGLAVLGALRAAHAVGIVHRDVKPANVLLGPHRRVVLTDFGIAHIQGEESLTMSGEFVGSLEFIAPERMSGRGAAGPASDLWSLGVLLYTAVEGWSPFRRTTLESTLAAILSADPPEPKQAGALGALIVRLLEKDPERRPAPSDVAAVLEGVAAAVAEGWPVPGPFGDSGDSRDSRAGGDSGDDSEEQDALELRELAEDVGTVRLGDAVQAAVRPSEPEPETTPTSNPAPLRPRPKRRILRYSAPLTALLVITGGIWLGTSSFGTDTETGSAAELTHGPSHTSTPTSTHTSTPTDSWTTHPEPAMDATLTLPAAYKEAAREGSASDPPRLVVYDLGDTIQVRLTQWDKAPGSPMARAQAAHDTWDSYNRDADTQVTVTSFHGDEAVLVDTAYDLEERPTRVMQLIILTADRRMYELRVDMPKGTKDEKKGTAVYKAARDRLEIGK